jgi:hypothetical protein
MKSAYILLALRFETLKLEVFPRNTPIHPSVGMLAGSMNVNVYRDPVLFEAWTYALDV